MSDPSQNQPFLYGSALVAAAPADPVVQDFSQQPASVEQQPTVIVAVDEGQAPIDGEVIPPAPETPPSIPQYPIGLIDFNQPIVVIDSDEYSDEPHGNPQIITILKGSTNPVVVSFWKNGEQCIAQFDTDGQSSCGDYKIEQDLIYPVTRWVVIGRDGRNLTVDSELYATEDAARDETGVMDIAGIFPVVIEAPAPTLAEDVAGAGSVHDGINEGEEQEDESEGDQSAATTAAPSVEAPTEMYVAGRNRRVGETVYASRRGFGTRACRIVKLRRDSHKSLFLDPQDGNAPYWALNKNVRYG